MHHYLVIQFPSISRHTDLTENQKLSGKLNTHIHFENRSILIGGKMCCGFNIACCTKPREENPFANPKVKRRFIWRVLLILDVSIECTDPRSRYL